MSESKHTPGPWGLTEHNGPRDITCRRKHWRVGQLVGGQRGVAIVFGPEAGPNPTDANARLVAAAPQLLAALEELVVVCDELDAREDLPHEFDGLILDRAHAALARVKQ